MIKVGMKVRFSPGAVARANAGVSNPVKLPGPDEVFSVQAVKPWIDGTGKERFDEEAWADLGPTHPYVLIKLLEQVP